jgi:SPP1 family predicted phage head-tail adaptor
MASVLNAGDLNRVVDLESDSITRTKGVESKTATVYAERVYAKVEPLSGSEFWTSQQINSQINWKVTLRYRTDIRAQHRIIYGTRRLEILAVLPDEDRRDFVRLMCREMNG